MLRAVTSPASGMPDRESRSLPVVPDPIFADPRLASIYDDVDGDRADLDHYEAIVDELGAPNVLDIGCGTGAFGCRLAAHGLTVFGVDPAQASLDVARSKAGADRVTWLLGDATTLPAMQVAVATMTGNVAQVFLTDEEWFATLIGARNALCEGGHLVFEVRDPAYRGWQEWTTQASRSVSDTVAGPIEHSVQLTRVSLPLVSFRHSFRFLDSGDIVTSDSTLRFRNRHEITSALIANGFTIEDIRDAPDRPGREFVFVCRASPAQSR